jgi:rhamnosyltransferase subunit B
MKSNADSGASSPAIDWGDVTERLGEFPDRPLAILSAPGSRGDVNPMVAIGRQLRARGYDCVISLAEPYADQARQAGLVAVSLISREAFDALLGVPDVWKPLAGLRAILQGAASDFLGPHFDLIRRLKRPGRTVLISHPLDFASRIHRDLDPTTPLVDVFLSPAMVRSETDPPLLTPWWFEPRRPPWLVRTAYWIGDHCLLDRYVAGSVNRLRASVGLAPVRRVMDRWWLSPDAILSLYPEWFGPTPPTGGGQWTACGFPLAVNPPLATDPFATKLFDGAPPGFVSPRIGSPGIGSPGIGSSRRESETTEGSPIFFTPGTAHRHARPFFEMAIAVCQQLNRPAILATSHTEQIPADLPMSVRAVGYVPLDRVLPSCGAIVHHGGVGTTAQAIAAACPQVILPMAFDQFHNGKRIGELGLGHSLPRPSEGRLYRSLADVLTNGEVHAACRRFADLTTGPDGAEVAAERIAAIFH